MMDFSDDELESLLQVIQDQRGVDFTGYKRPTLRRRVAKRINTLGLQDINAYRERVESDGREVDALLDTVLIGVTSFFRDPDMWDALRERALPDLLPRRDGQGPLRVWCVGCSTGEEVYSLLILMAEHLGRFPDDGDVRVHATDRSADALAAARQAVYGEQALEALTEHQRATYFEPRTDGFAVHRNLRKLVIFGNHDVLSDPPIGNIDLLLCRNLLIYLTSGPQQFLIPRLQYALKPSGMLVLGRSETTLARSKSFDAIDGKQRIFRKRGVPGERAATDELLDAARGPAARLEGSAPIDHDAARLLDPLRTGTIVLDGAARLIAANDRARAWFGLSDADLNAALKDLQLSYRPAELRSRVDRAIGRGESAAIAAVEWRDATNDALVLDIDVVPLAAPDRTVQRVMLAFYDVTERVSLERKLAEAQENLETTTEELKSANEELQTTNEELQSTNEELKTTNEELQSTNAELETVNDELKAKNAELRAYRTSMESLLDSLDFGLINVDKDRTVTVWNRACAQMWGLRDVEVIGRRLDDLDIGLPTAEIDQSLTATLHGTPTRLDYDVAAVDRRGRPIVCRVMISPVQQRDEDMPSGAVLFIEDVTDARRTDAALERGHFAEVIVDSVRDPFVVLDTSRRVLLSNAAFRHTFHISGQEILGRDFLEIDGGVWDRQAVSDTVSAVLERGDRVDDVTFITYFPRSGERNLRLNARRLLRDDTVPPRVLLVVEDMTAR